MKITIINAFKGKNGLALGAGMGMIAGWFFDNAGFGLVLGAAVALVIRSKFLGESNESDATTTESDGQSNGKKSNDIGNAT